MSSPETEPSDPADDPAAADAAADDRAADDAAADDRVADDAAADDRVADDAADTDAVSDDALSDDAPSDDAGAEGDDDGRSLLAALPPLTPPEVEPVRRRRRRDKRRAQEAAAADEPPMPSLASPLLSGRSLEPTRKQRRFEVLRDHPRWLIAGVVVVVLAVGLVAGKLFAERAADAAMDTRSAELEELLADATPEEFLAFSSGVEQPGSIAERTRNLDGFVNVKATASQSFIRFQPSGWWAGFTERCLVAVVRNDGVTITVPKKACIRVEAPAS